MNPLAGPIEISGPEIALIMLAAAVIFLGPPIAGAFIGRWLYRRRTPAEQQTPRGSVKWAVIGTLIAIALMTFVGFLEDLFA